MLKQLLSVIGFLSISFTVFASASGAESAPLLSYQMLFKAINLILLLLLLHRFARKPIVKMLSTSAENTKKTIDNSKEALANAESQLSEYEAKIANLEKELATRQQTSLASIEIEKERLISDAKIQSQKLEEQFQNRIEQDVLKAKAEIRAFLVNESSQLAEQIIAEQIGSKERKALVKNYAKYLNKTA
jgi:F-type H+-transporting ATPase subunit b